MMPTHDFSIPQTQMGYSITMNAIKECSEFSNVRPNPTAKAKIWKACIFLDASVLLLYQAVFAPDSLYIFARAHRCGHRGERLDILLDKDIYLFCCWGWNRPRGARIENEVFAPPCCQVKTQLVPPKTRWLSCPWIRYFIRRAVKLLMFLICRYFSMYNSPVLASDSYYGNT